MYVIEAQRYLPVPALCVAAVIFEFDVEVKTENDVAPPLKYADKDEFVNVAIESIINDPI